MVRKAARALGSSSTTRMRALNMVDPEARGVPGEVRRCKPCVGEENARKSDRRANFARASRVDRATGPRLAPGARMEAKSVYSFGAGRADAGRELRELLGGKGAHLGEMARLGLPIPPGFTVSTAVC